MIGEAAACEVGADAATGDVGSEFTAGEVASGIYSSLERQVLNKCQMQKWQQQAKKWHL